MQTQKLKVFYNIFPKYSYEHKNLVLIPNKMWQPQEFAENSDVVYSLQSGFTAWFVMYLTIQSYRNYCEITYRHIKKYFTWSTVCFFDIMFWHPGKISFNLQYSVNTAVWLIYYEKVKVSKWPIIPKRKREICHPKSRRICFLHVNMFTE